jgi:hypothetical protein
MSKVITDAFGPDNVWGEPRSEHNKLNFPAEVAPPVTLASMNVIGTWRGAVYVELPAELRRPITGGCSCRYCKAHPAELPTWNVLVVPVGGRDHTWTVHNPDVAELAERAKMDRGNR